MDVPFFKPSLDSTEFSALYNFFTTGFNRNAATTQFSKNICSLLKQPYCILFKSGTLALYSILLSLELKEGDEIIVSNVVCEGVINAIEQATGTPILIDVEPINANINASCIEKAITNRTKAIIAIHYGGVPCDIKLISKICKKYSILLIEDAAQALGAFYNGQPCGSLGDISFLSFYANKIITTAEGGAVVCSSKLWSEKIMSLCYKHNELLYESLESPICSSLKFEFLMDDLLAVIGVHQLSKLKLLINKRKEICEIYNEHFAQIPHITIPKYPNEVEPSYYQYVLNINNTRNGLSIKQIIDKLSKFKIQAYHDFIPLHQKLRYKNIDPLLQCAYPISTKLATTRISLPCYPNLSYKQLMYVINSFKSIFNTSAF